MVFSASPLVVWGCRLSRRPQKGQRLIFLFFFWNLLLAVVLEWCTVCFTWTRASNSQRFPRLFVPLFKRTVFFHGKFFFKVRKKVYLFGVYAGDIHLHISIYLSIHPSIYLYPCACTSNAQYCDFHARQRQHVEWWIGYLFSAFSSATALQATPAAHSFWELHCNVARIPQEISAA